LPVFLPGGNRGPERHLPGSGGTFSDFTKRDVYVACGAIVLLLISNAIHEAGHAFVAWWMGDRRPEIRRRMTLNPINHIHPILTIVLPLVTYYFLRVPMGGARPVMVDAESIGPRRMALVAIAGPFGNALFAVILALVTAGLLAFDVIDDVDAIRSWVFSCLILSIWFSVTLVVINLIPLPPADGSRVAAVFMPASVRRVYYALAPITVILLAALVLWVSGILYRWFPAVGRGHPEYFEKSRIVVEDQVFDLADKIRSLK
jgi:Zn-dependent protease